MPEEDETDTPGEPEAEANEPMTSVEQAQAEAEAADFKAKQAEIDATHAAANAAREAKLEERRNAHETADYKIAIICKAFDIPSVDPSGRPGGNATARAQLQRVKSWVINPLFEAAKAKIEYEESKPRALDSE